MFLKRGSIEEKPIPPTNTTGKLRCYIMALERKNCTSPVRRPPSHSNPIYELLGDLQPKKPTTIQKSKAIRRKRKGKIDSSLWQHILVIVCCQEHPKNNSPRSPLSLEKLNGFHI
jgi:hypothetical protein